MGEARSILPPKGWYHAVLCRVQKAQRSHRSRFLSVAEDGRGHRFPRRRYYDVCAALRVVPFPPHAVWFEECPRYLPAGRRYYTVACKWETALVYLDDVIIYSKTVTEHFAHVREFSGLLPDAGVSLKLSKCAFFDTSLTCLGHVIQPGRLEVERKNGVAIERARPPQNQAELRSFLGICNVYRRFVKGFAKIAAPLNRKTGKINPSSSRFFPMRNTRRSWSSSSASCPHRSSLYPVTEKCPLDTDACAYQVGCTLLQEQPSGERVPIGYWSRALTDAEKNYTTTEKECLVVVWSILTLRPYLYRNTFDLGTDHEAPDGSPTCRIAPAG
ncbi:unnamed protein product [Chondrus crispus]|uniref:Uncharacterized protein n=1 Tax=Chondrus crispus TaxID=2769 RepID=R7Q8B2_CHOCR|nr:unnamed protein product [Chondrus crispus]CDF33720.1 unnamed protein product [Chondrus crispus]|eukprot:XP_005713539.1 unnamed protein product [Chondrus crispus]